MSRKSTVALLVAAGAAIGFGVAPANATTTKCVGNFEASACVAVDPAGLPTVDPTGGPGYTDCIYVILPSCVPIDVPTPSVTPGTDPWVVQVTCGGETFTCEPIRIG